MAAHGCTPDILGGVEEDYEFEARLDDTERPVLKKTKTRAGEMLKVFATKPDTLNSIPRVHMIEKTDSCKLSANLTHLLPHVPLPKDVIN